MLTPRRSNRLAGLEPDVHPTTYYNINRRVPDMEEEIQEEPRAEVCLEMTMIFTAFVFFVWLMTNNSPPSVHFHAI